MMNYGAMLSSLGTVKRFKDKKGHYVDEGGGLLPPRPDANAG